MVYKIEQKFSLSEQDFRALRGSSLHETLYRNRIFVKENDGYNSNQKPHHPRDLVEEISLWLEANCGSFYHVDPEPSYRTDIPVYIEKDEDIMHFRLVFHGSAINSIMPSAEDGMKDEDEDGYSSVVSVDINWKEMAKKLNRYT